MASIANILFIYDRVEQTKLVLEGIRKNRINELIVFSDGAKNSSNAERVKELRDFIKRINWAKVELYENETNLGLAASVISGVNKVFLKNYNRVIVLEDDCVPTAGFYSFMHEAFKKYETQRNVMHISGFGLPLHSKVNHDGYFTPYPCSWGWGVRKEDWISCNFDNQEKYEALLMDSNMKKKFNSAGEGLSEFLEKQLRGEINSWLIRWYFHIFTNKGLCLWAKDSFINNVGFDGKGVHKVKYDRFNQEVESVIAKKVSNFDLPDPTIENRLMREFRRYFMGSSFKERLKTIFYMIYKKFF